MVALVLHAGLGLGLACDLLPVGRRARPELRPALQMEHALEREAVVEEKPAPEPPLPLEEPEVALEEHSEPTEPPTEAGAAEVADARPLAPLARVAEPVEIFRRSRVPGVRPRREEEAEAVEAREMARTQPPRPQSANAVAGFVGARPQSGQCPKPPYPSRAVERGWTGTVRVRVHVDRLGQPTDVVVLASSGYDLLDDVVKRTILRAWRFTPARRGEATLPDTWEKSFRFRLER